MTKQELVKWCRAAEKLGVKIVIGPQFEHPDPVQVTEANIDELVSLDRLKLKQKEIAAEPQPAFNQHPEYEAWKKICPNCRSRSTTHYNGKSEEFNVMLRCTDCGYNFSLEQAFKTERHRQLIEAAVDRRG